MGGGGLLVQEGPVHLDVAPGFGQDGYTAYPTWFQVSLEFVELRCAQCVDHSTQTRSHDCAGAHSACLTARVQSRCGGLLRRETRAGPSCELQLGVGRDVVVRDLGIDFLGQHLAACSNQNRTEWLIACGSGLARQCDCSAQVQLVLWFQVPLLSSREDLEQPYSHRPATWFAMVGCRASIPTKPET